MDKSVDGRDAVRSQINVFISHSSEDKPAVRRLADALAAKGVEVWLDENQIKIGEEIDRAVMSGLDRSTYVCVWLTQKALTSDWVREEINFALAKENETRKVVVFPLLGEHLEIPALLKGRKYANFTKDWSFGFNDLLASLDLIHPRSKGRKILAYTKDYLDDMSDEEIHIPFHPPIRIVSRLKQLRRSGKLVRLESMRPKIPIRSVYDHILSVAHSADCLFDVVEHGLRPEQANDLARFIAFHELNEVLLGDIPSFTRTNESKRESAEIRSANRLAAFERFEREKRANDFISLYLDRREAEILREVSARMRDASDEVARFANVLDRLDPMVAIWRYLHYHRDRLQKDGDMFVHRLRDFFKNLQVRQEIARNSRDKRVADTFLALQDQENASSYCRDRKAIFRQEIMFGLPKPVVVDLIEGRSIIYAPNPRTG
jgi:5'-deoxynucleotidase YfbR-like HD superfamily hydrolase